MGRIKVESDIIYTVIGEFDCECGKPLLISLENESNYWDTSILEGERTTCINKECLKEYVIEKEEYTGDLIAKTTNGN